MLVLVWVREWKELYVWIVVIFVYNYYYYFWLIYIWYLNDLLSRNESGYFIGEIYVVVVFLVIMLEIIG